jgi:predicted GNAT family acetyltransferase
MPSTELESKDKERIIADIEVERRQRFPSDRIGRILVTDSRIEFSYRSDGSSTSFGEHELSMEPFAQYVDDDLKAVFMTAADDEAVSQLKSDYIDAVAETTGLSHSMDVLADASPAPENDVSECSCTLISSNNVLVENENMELSVHFDEGEFRFVSCEDCFRIYGRYRHGKKASLTTLTSADWLFEGDLSFESIVEFDGDDAYAIHHSPGGATRARDTILTLSHIGQRSEDIVSTYKHDYQHGLCYVVDDKVVGYLAWESHERGPILSQLYVRETHRGNGFAANLVSGWYDHVCDSTQYFVDELTPGGRAVLSSIGHLSGDSPTAHEVFSQSPMAFG